MAVRGGFGRPAPLTSFLIKGNQTPMNTRRRLALLTLTLSLTFTTAATVTLTAPALVASAQDGDGVPPPVSDESAETEIGKCQPQQAGDEIVHSWALAPAGSDNPAEAGNRPNLSFTGDAGSEVPDAVTLYNFSNQQLNFRVYATDAFNNAEGQFDLLPGTEEPTDVGTWVTFAQDLVTVAACEQVTIPITLTIPDNASPGDHTGAVLASNEAVSSGPQGDLVTLDRRTGTRLYVRVGGTLRAELAIEELSTDYRSVLNPLSGSASVSYRIQNRGNVRLSGKHSVSVSGPFGLAKQRVAAADFPELLPGQGVDITTIVDDVPAFGLAFTTVAIEPAAGGDGIVAGDSSRKATTFAPPIAVLLVLLLLLFGLLAKRARRRHRTEVITPNYVLVPPAELAPVPELEPVPERQRT